jgi:hypothetical protein
VTATSASKLSGNRRWRAGFLLVGIFLAALFATFGFAEAQQRVERRSIIDMIFGQQPLQHYPPPPPRAAPPPPRAAEPQARRPARRSEQPAPRKQAAEPAPPPQPSVEKAEDAAKILVVGDFMASGLAEGLRTAFAEDEDIAVIEETNGSSGLVRDDFHDWPAVLPEMIETVEPQVVVVMLGSNDRQEISADGTSLALLSEPWIAEYGSRVSEIAEIVKNHGAELVWVGAPAFQSPRMTADILAINEIYRNRLADGTGTFVDIWDGFVDEQGRFVFTGSDIQGQQVRLRGNDGINMTDAGKRKLAFYAEKPIRRILGETGEAVATSPLSGGATPALTALPPELALRTPPMRITDPAFDGAEALLGAEAPVDGLLQSPRERLVEEGLASRAPVGRADNFRWPRVAAEDAEESEAGEEEESRPRAAFEAEEDGDASAAITRIIRESGGAL